jgi:hypothetical protein
LSQKLKDSIVADATPTSRRAPSPALKSRAKVGAPLSRRIRQGCVLLADLFAQVKSPSVGKILSANRIAHVLTEAGEPRLNQESLSLSS